MRKYQRGEIVAFISTETIHYQGRPNKTRERIDLVQIDALSRDRSTITRVKTHPALAPLKVEHLSPRPTLIQTIGTPPCKSLPEGSGSQQGAQYLFRTADIGELSFRSKDAAVAAIRKANVAHAIAAGYLPADAGVAS